MAHRPYGCHDVIMDDDIPVDEDRGQMTHVSYQTDQRYGSIVSDILARVGCAIPFLALGGCLLFLGGYLGLAVIDAANDGRSALGSCDPEGPAAFLGGVAFLGVCGIVAAGLVVSPRTNSSTWWRLVTIALVLGVAPIALGFASGGQCSVMH